MAPVAAGILGITDGDGRFRHEYTAYQLETVTSVHTRLDRLYDELAELRLLAARAALRFGARLVATGAPPFRRGPLGSLTDDARYRRLADRYPEATTAAAGTCGCHVHIGIADRDLAVDVLTRLRPWLPALLAVTGNSPLAEGMDCGYSSRRYEARRRWPTFRAPGAWTCAAEYDRAVAALIADGSALDAGGVHLLARLSSRYPTIEVRIADTCLDTSDTVMFAGLVRALVAALIDDARHHRESETPTAGELEVALAAAARNGLATDRHCPLTEGHHPPNESRLPRAEGHYPPTEGRVPWVEGHHLQTEDPFSCAEGHHLPTESPFPPTEGHQPPSENRFPPGDDHYPPSDSVFAPTDHSYPSTEGSVSPTDGRCPPAEGHYPPLTESHRLPAGSPYPPGDRSYPPGESEFLQTRPPYPHLTSTSSVGDRLRALLRKATPALTEAGDAFAVRSELGRLLMHGTGADRQRELLGFDSRPDAFVATMAECTAPGTTDPGATATRSSQTLTTT
ncbi:YbdK family carboxylate-amine ligase [Dactylosporangium sp. CA-233914]|uniref:YbdK family carboxylate-amine ligase n=1 Tax=Dactylosporangium sp. CA-233914 TaxID=3239934 RepID=UPI003D8DC495